MTNNNTIYPFKVKMLNGKEKSLSDFQGKVLMVVNTASGCGFTPQLKDLQELRSQFPSDKFEILGFPSNDFGAQEPLEGSEITKFCEVNFGVQFPIFDKTIVRGKNAHPLFKFLSSKKLNGQVGASPRWNFHKYIVNAKGEVVDYFYPFTKPSAAKIKKRIQLLLEEII